MPDYSQGKIYRLTCNNLDLVYYGSTVDTLERRLKGHISKYNAWLRDNTKDYLSSFKLLEVGDVEIELIIDCPCESKRELEEVEQTFIQNDDCCNKQRAFRTKEQKKEYNKEYNKEYDKTDKAKERKKEYMKKYYERNSEYLKQSNKEYRMNQKTIE